MHPILPAILPSIPTHPHHVIITQVIGKDKFQNIVLFPPSLVFYVVPNGIPEHDHAAAVELLGRLDTFGKMHATKNRRKYYFSFKTSF